MKLNPNQHIFLRYIFIIGLSFLMLWLATACGSQPDAQEGTNPGGGPSDGGTTEEGSPSATTESSGGDTPTEPDPAEIERAWLTSAHAVTFVINDVGENSTCARCHAPVNWIPTMDDMPEACFACKFEVDPPPPLIPEEEWAAIPCNVCHQVDKKDNVSPEIAWLEIAPIEQYAEVASSTELCLMCHAGIDLPDHEAIQMAGSHAQDDCTLCHDAHNTTASCASTDCHADVLEPAEPLTGHDDDHANVSCMACHDGGDMQVGVLDGEEDWSTLLVTEVDGVTSSVKFTSHNIALEASCDRCHFTDNPWELLFPVESP